MPPFPIPDLPCEEHRHTFNSAATEDAAHQIEDKAAGLSGFASPALVKLLADQGAGIKSVLIEDTSGRSHNLRDDPTEGVYYRLCMVGEDFAEWLNIYGYGPASLRDEMREAGERARKATCGGIRAVRFIANDGGEHLLSAKSPSPKEDMRFVVMLLRWRRPEATIKS